jgi:hypothetical protein
VVGAILPTLFQPNPHLHGEVLGAKRRASNHAPSLMERFLSKLPAHVVGH